METIKNFIIRKFNNFSAEIEIKYAFDSIINTHIIEFKYDISNLKFIDFELDFYDEFEEKFPNDDLLITNRPELINSGNIIYQKDIIKNYLEYLFQEENIQDLGNNYALAA